MPPLNENNLLKQKQDEIYSINKIVELEQAEYEKRKMKQLEKEKIKFTDYVTVVNSYDSVSININLDIKTIAKDFLSSTLTRTGVPASSRDREELITQAFDYAEDFINEAKKRGY